MRFAVLYAIFVVTVDAKSLCIQIIIAQSKMEVKEEPKILR